MASLRKGRDFCSGAFQSGSASSRPPGRGSIGRPGGSRSVSSKDASQRRRAARFGSRLASFGAARSLAGTCGDSRLSARARSRAELGHGASGSRCGLRSHLNGLVRKLDAPDGVPEGLLLTGDIGVGAGRARGDQALEQGLVLPIINHAARRIGVAVRATRRRATAACSNRSSGPFTSHRVLPNMLSDESRDGH